MYATEVILEFICIDVLIIFFVEERLSERRKGYFCVHRFCCPHARIVFFPEKRMSARPARQGCDVDMCDCTSN